jgi:signal transduction histidine kinase
MNLLAISKFTSKHASKIPAFLVLLITGMLVLATYMSVRPLYQLALERETTRTHKIVENISRKIDETILGMKHNLEFTLSNDAFVDDLNKLIKGKPNNALRRIRKVLGNTHISLFDVVSLDGQILTSIGSNQRTGQSIAEWDLFKGYAPPESSGVTIINDKLVMSELTAIFNESHATGYAATSIAFDGALADSLAMYFDTNVSIYQGQKLIATTFSEDLRSLISSTSEERAVVGNGAERLVINKMALLTRNGNPVGSIIIGTSLKAFDQSIREVITNSLIRLMVPYLFTIFLITSLSNRIIAGARHVETLLLKMEKTLVSTKEMSSAGDQLSAAAIAAKRIGEFSSGLTNTRMFLLTQRTDGSTEILNLNDQVSPVAEPALSTIQRLVQLDSTQDTIRFYDDNCLIALQWGPERLGDLLFMGINGMDLSTEARNSIEMISQTLALSIKNLNYRVNLEKIVEDRTKKLGDTIAEVSRKHRKISSIMENIKQGIVTIDTNGIIESEFSHHMTELFALPAEKILGSRISTLFVGNTQENHNKTSVMETVMQTSMGHNYEIWDRNVRTLPTEIAIRSPGATADRILSLEWVPLMGDSGKVEKVMLSIRDLTEQRELQESNAKAMLDKINLEMEMRALRAQTATWSSLSEMASGVAHEINNPLTIITGRAQLLSRLISSKKASQEQSLEHVKKIIVTVERIAVIIRGLMDFSRNAESDPFQRFNLASIFHNVKNLCSEKLLVNNISLSMTAPSDLTIECRGVQLEQVLNKLISNAHDAVCDLQEKWIRIEATVVGETVEISVTDSGRGIDTEIADKIMQPFFTTKEVGKGTGLGLSTSKGIVEGHRGNLRLDRPSPNTRFVIEMPINQSEKPLATAEAVKIAG